MLVAAVGEGDRARAAYRAWREAVDFHGQLDDGSFRLLPRLYKNLMALGLSDADTPRLRGIHRQAWATSQVLGALLEAALLAFGAAGIATIVLKGGALGRLYYGDPGERPMNDVDLLVRPHDARRAFEILARLGWVPDANVGRPLPSSVWPPSARSESPADLPIGHGWSFGLPADRRATGLGLDLHWYAIPQCLRPDADARFFARAQPFRVGNATALTLAPEDHFLHALAHGAMWNVVPTIRWAADAALISRKKALDWNVICDEARFRGLTQPICETSDWLATHLGVARPALVERLHDAASVVDRWRYAFALHPWSDRETLAHAAFDCYRYLEGRPMHAAPVAISRWLEQRWGSKNPLRVAWTIARKRFAIERL